LTRNLSAEINFFQESRKSGGDVICFALCNPYMPRFHNAKVVRHHNGAFVAEDDFVEHGVNSHQTDTFAIAGNISRLYSCAPLPYFNFTGECNSSISCFIHSPKFHRVVSNSNQPNYTISSSE
uniref:C3H1-type domain-containing protein n=1 Tax=Haemonchus placei TaxID=6290 RepID=A0A0N4WSG7_HAEPC